MPATELAKINATVEKFLRKLRNYTLMKKNCVWGEGSNTRIPSPLTAL